MGKPAYQILADFWTASKFDIKFGPNSFAAVSELEQKYAVKLPPAFRDYLLYACPKSVDQSDPELTTWWELERLKSLEEELSESSSLVKNPEIKKDAGQFIVFVDYIFWCWAWAICCKPGKDYGRILQLSGEYEFVANGFDEFVKSYLEEWDKGFHLQEVEQG